VGARILSDAQAVGVSDCSSSSVGSREGYKVVGRAHRNLMVGVSNSVGCVSMYIMVGGVRRGCVYEAVLICRWTRTSKITICVE
jgi:hypothetical protein